MIGRKGGSFRFDSYRQKAIKKGSFNRRKGKPARKLTGHVKKKPPEEGSLSIFS